MKTRIISGIVMVPLLIFIRLGGWWTAALCILIGFIGTREFYGGFRAIGVNANDTVAFVFLVALYVLHGLWPEEHVLILFWIAACVMVCSLIMFDVGKHSPFDAMVTMIGIIYIIFFSFHFVLIEQTGKFAVMKWLVLLSAFGSDIFAYFTGYFLGRHKLCPRLSPKKTIEGAVGGITGSAVLCLIFGYLFCREYLVSCLIIGLAGAAVSMCGDLTASAYKRKMGIKDYGNLIPGHGGIMDRFDSVLFTAPFVYYYIVIVLEYFHAGF